MTNEDAVAWCAAREVSVIFRPNATMKKSVVVLVHGSSIKAEKATLPEAVEEASMKLSRYFQAEREIVEARRRAEADGTGQRSVTPPDLRIP